MINPSDYVKVNGTAFRVPPKASRDSMETMMLGGLEANDSKVKAKAKKYHESASGFVPQNIIGKVLAIQHGLLVIQNAVTGEIEHADPDKCQKIKICKMCGQREAGEKSEYCSKKNCQPRK